MTKMMTVVSTVGGRLMKMCCKTLMMMMMMDSDSDVNSWWKCDDVR